jgi:hypothetical protein
MRRQKARHEGNAPVIGAGHDGLFAAAHLARAARRVTVADRNDPIPAAPRSDAGPAPLCPVPAAPLPARSEGPQSYPNQTCRSTVLGSCLRQPAAGRPLGRRRAERSRRQDRCHRRGRGPGRPAALRSPMGWRAIALPRGRHTPHAPDADLRAETRVPRDLRDARMMRPARVVDRPFTRPARRFVTPAGVI